MKRLSMLRTIALNSKGFLAVPTPAQGATPAEPAGNKWLGPLAGVQQTVPH